MAPGRVASPLSSECGTYKTVNARFWPWFSGEILSNVERWCLFTRKRTCNKISLLERQAPRPYQREMLHLMSAWSRSDKAFTKGNAGWPWFRCIINARVSLTPLAGTSPHALAANSGTHFNKMKFGPYSAIVAGGSWIRPKQNSIMAGNPFTTCSPNSFQSNVCPADSACEDKLPGSLASIRIPLVQVRSGSLFSNYFLTADCTRDLFNARILN